MEGPSLVIAREEFEKFGRRKVDSATGTLPLDFKRLKGARFLRARSWGKHFLLEFDRMVLRVHFLMFGSYRIDDPREDREPKLSLRFGGERVDFYTCAIRELDGDPDEIYDWSTDVMSDEWDPKRALRAIRAKPEMEVADALMDQAIFTGVGNIIKNEVLYRLRLHPETPVGALSAAMQRRLVAEARRYCFQFYEWKKAGVLKRNWLIFRKRKCPECGSAVIKRPTGKGERFSHWCPVCQPLERRMFRARAAVPAGKRVSTARETRLT
jgi:endonuclease-8